MPTTPTKAMATAAVLVVLLTGCGPQATGVNETSEAAKKEIEAAKAIRKLGGHIDTKDNHVPGKPVIGVYLDGTAMTDAGMKELKEFKNLQTLGLGGTQVTDAGMKELKDLKNLRVLGLNGTQVTDAGMKELKDLKNLQVLGLNPIQVTDAVLRALLEIGLLHALDQARAEDKRPSEDADVTELLLGNTQVTDAGMKELKGLKNLQKLFLNQTQVTDSGLKELKELKNLRVLYLVGTQVTDAGIKEMKEALPECLINH